MSMYFLLLFIATLKMSSCSWEDSQKMLLTTLFSNYDKLVRPSQTGNATIVNVRITLLSLTFIDEKTQTLNMKTIFEFNWIDNRLSWNASNFEGEDTIYLPQSKIWLPSPFFQNGRDMYDTWGYEDLLVTIHSDGNIHWGIPKLGNTACEINVFYFPFDTQRCSLQIMLYPLSAKYTEAKSEAYQPVIKKFFERNSEWELIDATLEEKHIDFTTVFKVIRYELEFRRLSLYYVMSIILPVCFISLSAPGVFLLPCEAGEKVSLSITVLLAYAVYLTIITDSLPVSSTHLCLLHAYLTVLLGVTALAVLLSVVSLRIHHKSPSIPVGSKITLFVCVFRKLMCLARKDLDVRENKPPMVSSDIYHSKFAWDNLSETLNDNLNYSADNLEVITWPLVQETMDRMFFYIFSIGMTLSAAVIIPFLMFGG